MMFMKIESKNIGDLRPDDNLRQFFAITQIGKKYFEYANQLNID